ncbi:MAG: hypothetical protein AABY22_34745 [Nanoarchaeota archaeon]
MSRDGVMFLVVVFLVILTWFIFANEGKFTGFATVQEKYSDMDYLGVFYDAGKGAAFALEYDVFFEEESKGHFSSAIEVCQTLFPSSEKVWETSVVGEKQIFTSRLGKKKQIDPYANYCYG